MNGHGVEKIGGTSMAHEGDVQFIVDLGHHDAAVQALHRALVENEDRTAEGRRAA